MAIKWIKSRFNDSVVANLGPNLTVAVGRDRTLSEEHDGARYFATICGKPVQDGDNKLQHFDTLHAAQEHAVEEAIRRFTKALNILSGK